MGRKVQQDLWDNLGQLDKAETVGLRVVQELMELLVRWVPKEMWEPLEPLVQVVTMETQVIQELRDKMGPLVNQGIEAPRALLDNRDPLDLLGQKDPQEVLALLETMDSPDKPDPPVT